MSLVYGRHMSIRAAYFEFGFCMDSRHTEFLNCSRCCQSMLLEPDLSTKVWQISCLDSAGVLPKRRASLALPNIISQKPLVKQVSSSGIAGYGSLKVVSNNEGWAPPSAWWMSNMPKPHLSAESSRIDCWCEGPNAPKCKEAELRPVQALAHW